MNKNAETVDTVERELHFINRKCGFVQQPDTSNLIEIIKNIERKSIYYLRI